MGEAQVRDKALALLSSRYGDDTARDICAAALAMEEVPDVRRLRSLWARPPT